MLRPWLLVSCLTTDTSAAAAPEEITTPSTDLRSGADSTAANHFKNLVHSREPKRAPADTKNGSLLVGACSGFLSVCSALAQECSPLAQAKAAAAQAQRRKWKMS